ncbi:MAG: hypothetical protein ACFBZ8_06020 [Opitutales bacterium]
MLSKPRTHLWRRAILVLGALTIAIVAVTALGTVWLRGQLAESARRCADLENSLQRLERSAQEVQAQLSQLQSPAALLARLGDELRPPRAEQVVWLNPGQAPDVFVARQPPRVLESDERSQAR